MPAVRVTPAVPPVTPVNDVAVLPVYEIVPAPAMAALPELGKAAVEATLIVDWGNTSPLDAAATVVLIRPGTLVTVCPAAVGSPVPTVARRNDVVWAEMYSWPLTMLPWRRVVVVLLSWVAVLEPRVVYDTPSWPVVTQMSVPLVLVADRRPMPVPGKCVK